MRGADQMSKISIDREKCTLCETCVEICPLHIFSMQDSEIRTDNEEDCLVCGHCVSVCPVDAVSHEEIDPAAILPASEGLPLSPEALYTFLRSRRSCRIYETKEVSKQLLEKLVDIGRYAPTGHNRQNFEFIVLHHQASIDKISKMAATYFGGYAKELEASPEPDFYKALIREFRMDYEFSLQGKERIFRGAPVVILVHAPGEVGSSIDNCLYAIFHMVMMAETLGLGTCINRRFILATQKAPEISKELEIPAGNKIFGCVTVGFPKYKHHKLPPRKPAKVKWI
jgi:nitroreductase/NAD-dependent dihydropyrimidine dehydrogenase PreA subunit